MPMPAQLPRTGQAEGWLVGLTLLAGATLLGVGFAARRRRA
jgi:LPXTG-motif cell wall-anchored protein